MSIFDFLSDVWHKATGTPTASEKRNQMNMMNDQINAYKRSSQLADEAIASARDAKEIEKRRINEKQIRSLRRNFRPAGFLEDSTPGMSNTLG